MEYDHSVIEELWEQYIKLCPSAPKIHNLLQDKGELRNDHIAFRTFSDHRIDKNVLSQRFLEMGYSVQGNYYFSQKKLNAIHLEHKNPHNPKIFISELLLKEFSNNLQSVLNAAIDSIPDKYWGNKDLIHKGRLWSNPSYSVYETLSKESEYAAWMYVYGFRANHFTIYANDLQFKGLEELNIFLVNNGFVLNNHGGVIKGSKSVYLEQSSTLADKIEFPFIEGVYTIPGCYCEFAYRYPRGSTIFQGFVTESADKIFESTDRKIQSS
ncbi:DUF1338 domain-containing protein [Membranihabitans maritimus]|uniref:DUF1338 domain-containing protein n=1 Tax=Membranihabitans maritimus TaxID=2904244 RepID=UPI001F264785|nr:DUF1338 domain-containing protein [Membranihabitans maritimus]